MAPPPRPRPRRGKRKSTPRQRSAPLAGASLERAAAALRAGKAVIVKSGREFVMASAVEGLSSPALARLRKRAGKRLMLVLPHARGRTLKMRLYTPGVVALKIGTSDDPETLHAICDPTDDLAKPMKGPFETERGPLPKGFGAAVKLAKLSGLLPGVVAARVANAPRGSVVIDAEAILGYEDEAAKTLAIVARARVPLEDAEHTELVAFRSAVGGPEHYAIVIGAPSPSQPVLARLHSECFTGDLLGSLKCDCGPQLRGAIAAIAKNGGGVLLYLAQEGRGIGLINKLRAYRLQDQGFDTLEANERLGFEADERLYGVAARMFSLLGYKRVRLMTNNPDKVASLGAHGIDVVERVAHTFPTNRHNEKYIATKVRAGHLF